MAFHFNGHTAFEHSKSDFIVGFPEKASVTHFFTVILGRYEHNNRKNERNVMIVSDTKNRGFFVKPLQSHQQLRVPPVGAACRLRKNHPCSSHTQAYPHTGTCRERHHLVRIHHRLLAPILPCMFSLIHFGFTFSADFRIRQ